eukprot:scaffold4155_cov356-Prasinococcus_capsulatus_cf.AAC.1
MFVFRARTQANTEHNSCTRAIAPGWRSFQSRSLRCQEQSAACCMQGSAAAAGPGTRRSVSRGAYKGHLQPVQGDASLSTRRGGRAALGAVCARTRSTIREGLGFERTPRLHAHLEQPRFCVRPPLHAHLGRSGPCWGIYGRLLPEKAQRNEPRTLGLYGTASKAAPVCRLGG